VPTIQKTFQPHHHRSAASRDRRCQPPASGGSRASDPLYKIARELGIANDALWQVIKDYEAGRRYTLDRADDWLLPARRRYTSLCTYHGGDTEKYLGEVGGLDAALLMHLGEEDEFISKTAQAQIKAALAGKANAAVYSYPAQRHAFSRQWGALHKSREPVAQRDAESAAQVAAKCAHDPAPDHVKAPSALMSARRSLCRCSRSTSQRSPILFLIGLIAFNRGQRTWIRDMGRVSIGLGLMLLALHPARHVGAGGECAGCSTIRW
jgi:hypothetical protein